jgi:hypothetical protein
MGVTDDIVSELGAVTSIVAVRAAVAKSKGGLLVECEAFKFKFVGVRSVEVVDSKPEKKKKGTEQEDLYMEEKARTELTCSPTGRMVTLELSRWSFLPQGTALAPTEGTRNNEDVLLIR